MDKLIEALQIFLKYGNPAYPTHCEHDILYVAIQPDIITDEDKKALDKLGFYVDETENLFYSFKYGSC